MVLDAHTPRIIREPHLLDDAIASVPGFHDEAIGDAIEGLMVRAVHHGKTVPRAGVEAQGLDVGALHLGDIVAADVEVQRAAEREIQHLHAFANAEDGPAAFESVAEGGEFPGVAIWLGVVDLEEIGGRVGVKFRSHIGAAGKQEAINGVGIDGVAEGIGDVEIGVRSEEARKVRFITFTDPGREARHEGKNSRNGAGDKPNRCRSRGMEVALPPGVMRFLGVFLAFLAATVIWVAADSDGLKDVPFTHLSDRAVSPLGQAALAIRPPEWRHAESAHFVYHYFQSFVAGPVATEAEFYYGCITKELGKDSAQWERKCHIFVFEKAEDWQQFQVRGRLDPWTGGLHAQGELFVIRNPQFKWKGHTLGHEITHLVIYRFFGNGVPRWLTEGFAEYAGVRAFACFTRARGYRARPTSQSVDPAKFIPLAQLTSMLDYPADTDAVLTFYDESERLVRFLSAVDKRGFGIFLEAIAQGNRTETALSKGFGSRFPSLETLEREFKTYASKDHAP